MAELRALLAWAVTAPTGVSSVMVSVGDFGYSSVTWQYAWFQ